MLDNKGNHNITKSFVQNSWKDMANLLDKEMPTPPRRDKGLIMFLALLLLLTMGCLISLVYKQSQKIPVVNASKERIVYKHVYLDNSELEREAIQNNAGLNTGILPASIEDNTLNAKSSPQVVEGLNYVI